MIPSNLSDYVKKYEGFVSPDDCKKVVNVLENEKWELHTYYNTATDNYISYETDLSVAYSTEDSCKKIQSSIWYAIEQYIIKDFKDFDWFTGWSGYTEVRFNKYDKNTEMRRHCDHIHTMFDGTRKGIPTLTVLGALNTDFTGGEFVMWDDVEIKMGEGDVLIFPSNFMYPHKVCPVKEGTRYSFVSWVW
jgi:predicted 2-oxoglutarate/Fe(II)-dependent dioxygenase YbiX